VTRSAAVRKQAVHYSTVLRAVPLDISRVATSQKFLILPKNDWPLVAKQVAFFCILLN
jgi:hypothetical protein